VVSKGEMVVYAGGATPQLAYDVLTQGVKADQTPSRLHTIVDANTGATLSTWDEIETGTGHGIFVGAVPLGTTAGLTAAGGFSMRMAPTTVSGMLRRIAARGHLEDNPHPGDARSRLLHLNDDGVSVTAQAAAVLAATLPLRNDALVDGQDAIRAKLAVLDDGLRQLVGAAPRPYALPGTGQPAEDPRSPTRDPVWRRPKSTKSAHSSTGCGPGTE
jgi:hypothetical protein